MNGYPHDNGDVLDADQCDVLIDHFRQRLDVMQRNAIELREQFDELHRRWLAHIEKRAP